MQESDASQGSRSQGNISAKKKRGDGCQKLNKFQKKIPHQGKKILLILVLSAKNLNKQQAPIPPRTISWSYNNYLIFTQSMNERMHIAYRYKIKYKLAFSSKKFSEAATGGRLPQYIRPGDSYLYARLFLFVHSLLSLFQKLNHCSISIALIAQFV